MSNDVDHDQQARRANARWTALVVAAIAVAVYFGFILTSHFAR